MRLLDVKGMKVTYIKSVRSTRSGGNGFGGLAGLTGLNRGLGRYLQLMTDKGMASGETSIGTKIGTKIGARFIGVATDTCGRFTAPTIVFARSIVYQSYHLTYGIDLVTLNKKKLGKKPGNDNAYNIGDGVTFDYKVDTIQLIKQICPRGLSGFFGVYSQELLSFMIYLPVNLASMNSLDIITELFKFKTDYYNNKLQVVSIPRCNIFIDNFIEKLKDPQFIKSLPHEFNNSLAIYTAYATGIGNFKQELISLNNEGLSVPELSEKIDEINSKFLTSVKTIDDSYFKILIQINRYQILHNILQRIPNINLPQFNSTPIFVGNNNTDIVQTQISSIVGDLSQLPIDFNQSFYNYAPILFQSNNESAQKILETLLNLFSHGIIDDSFRIKDYLVIDHKFIPTLLHLKSIINCDFHQLSPEQILWVLETQIDRTNDPNLIELNDILMLKFKYDQSTQFLDDLIKINGKPQQEYTQIPDNLFLHDYVYQLQILQEEVMGKPFKFFTSDEIISKLHNVIFSTGNQLFEENLTVFTKLYYKLKTLFAINGGNTEVLDVLIYNQNVFNQFEEKIASKKQDNDASTSPLNIQVEPQHIVEEEIIPLQNKEPIEVNVTTTNDKGNNDSQLNQFIRELIILRDVFLKIPFSNTTCENINDILTKEINNIYSSDSSPHINNDNVLNFIRLHKRLNRMFRENGGNCAILDELIPSPEENIENEVKVYKQIPDSLPVHQFTQELIILQDEMNKKFADVSPNEIDSIIAEKVDNVLNKSNIPSKINVENVHTFIKLRQVLAKLFGINGGNTEILDKVIYSTQIFDKIEKSREPVRPYKQLPDDFHLEEYVLELIQLRNAVGGSFTGTSAAAVLEKIQSLASNTDSPDKKHIWNKLYRNIAMLFYHNNNNTFVLDSILVNGEHFIKFESKKVLQQQDKAIAMDDISKLFNEYWDEINEFFINMDLMDEVHEGKESFDELLDIYLSDQYLDSKETSSWYVVDKLRSLNSKIESFPKFLVELYIAKDKDNDLILTGKVVEEMYQFALKGAENEKNREPNFTEPFASKVETETVPISEPAAFEAEADSAPVVDEVSETKLKNNYNDSERLLALLSKETEPANFEKLTDRFIKDDDSEFIIKDAISIAMNKDHNIRSINEEQHERKFGNQNINKMKTTSTSHVDPSEINTKSIETFLRKAKKDKETARERKSREAEAYEWSRGTLNSNTLIDSNTLFDVDQNNKRPNNLLFPSSNAIDNENLEYILLSIDGQAIPSNIELIGQLPKEDIFQILNKFDKEDLNKFMRQFKRLQNDHWKVVGSKVETSFDRGDQKYLILSRNKDDSKGKSWVFTRLKTLFAVTGAVLTAMIFANIFLEERSYNKVKENERVEVPVVPTIPVDEDVPLEEKVKVSEADRESKSGWFWK